jgi:uncharacterized protein YjbI with pentapeptide repeats
MDPVVDKLIKKHRKSGYLTINENEIEPGWNWSDADLRDFHLEGLTFSNYDEKKPISVTNRPAIFTGAKFNGAHLSNIIAKGADFTNANMNEVKDALDANFQNADFYRAYMMDATFCYANFSGAYLTHVYFDKSNFKGAKLNGASLSSSYVPETNFSEASFKKTKLTSVRIDKAKGLETAVYLKELDETDPRSTIASYIYLEKYFKYNGWPDSAGEYYYRRKVLRRRIRKNPFLHFLSYIFDLLCGYGEHPYRMIPWIFIIISSFALIFFFQGGPYSNGSAVIYDNALSQLSDSFYFSGVTFTTLGFGDFHPNPSSLLMKGFAFIEALGGALFIALFVVSLSRKVMR